MGLITGATLAIAEINTALITIEKIADTIEETMRYVDDIIKEFNSQSEGPLVTKIKEALNTLKELTEKLIDGIRKIKDTIKSYVNEMVEQAKQATNKLIDYISGNNA